MKLQKLFSILLIVSSVWVLVISSVIAEEVKRTQVQSEGISSRDIPQLSEIELPITSAEKLVQAPTPETAPSSEVLQVTGVRANPTDKGVEVILQTTTGQQLQTINRSAGNSFIADIPNAQLRLPNDEAFTFRSEKPIAGITQITVTNFDANTIRVTVIGEAGVPIVDAFLPLRNLEKILLDHDID